MRFGYLLPLIMLPVALLGLLSSPCAATPPVTSIVDAKLAADGTPVSLTGAIISAAALDMFYVETDTRSSAIRVDKTAHGLRGGMRADVTGAVRTDAEGERYVAATTAVQNGSGIVRPIALSNRDLGGRDLLSATGTGQKGVRGGVGPNNIGLFVRTRGRVTYAEEYSFYVDDGSGVLDGSGHRGVKVDGSLGLCPGMDPIGWYVEVTGICSCYRAGDDLHRLVLATGTSYKNDVTTSSGLKYLDLKTGTGATAAAGSVVSVHYTLWITDCSKADSSVDRGQPFDFVVGTGAVIPGFDEGVTGMKVGGKRFLIVPYYLGYGEQGSYTIPPYETLFFEVELLGIE